MPLDNRHFIITAIILCCSIGIVFFLNQAAVVPNSSEGFSDFPLEIGQWQGRDLPVEEEVLQVLQTRDVMVREYKNGQSDTVYLAIVYSQGERAAFHPPELCYLGGGAQLLGKAVEPVTLANGRTLKTNTLSMKDKKSLFKAWYWFAAGGDFTHSYYRQQLKLLYNWLRYRSKQGALIRVSAAINPENIEESESKAKGFIREVVPVIEVFLEKLQGNVP